MGEAARAAAGQHQADAASGQQARDAFDIVAVAHVMQLRAGLVAIHARAAAEPDVAALQQHQMTRPLHVRDRPPASANSGHALGRRRALAGSTKQSAWRTHSSRQSSCSALGEIDHEAIARLDRAEPVAGVARAGLRVDQRAAAVALSASRSCTRKAARIDAGIVRQQRERARARTAAGARVRAIRRCTARRARLQHRVRMVLDQCREAAPRQAQQFRVAQRAHGGRARLVDDQAEFADRFAGRDDAVEHETAVRRRA